MFHEIAVDNLDLPELAPYRTLRRPHDHRERGIFIAEGEKVALRLFESGIETLSVLISPGKLEAHRTTIAGATGDFPVFVAPQPLLEAIVGFRLHQGILAIGRIPESVPLADRLRARVASSPKPLLVVALDGLADPENVGILVRSSTALGADALLASANSSSPWLRRSVRNSMGTVFRLPIYEIDSLPETLTGLERDFELQILAADARGTAMDETDLTGHLCVVLGNEDTGVSPAVLERCHGRIAIPMEPGVDSLNVAAAGAAILWEVGRQRRAGNASRAR